MAAKLQRSGADGEAGHPPFNTEARPESEEIAAKTSSCPAASRVSWCSEKRWRNLPGKADRSELDGLHASLSAES